MLLLKGRVSSALKNIPVFGVVKGGKVVPLHPEDLEGDKALRVKPKG